MSLHAPCKGIGVFLFQCIAQCHPAKVTTSVVLSQGQRAAHEQSLSILYRTRTPPCDKRTRTNADDPSVCAFHKDIGIN